MIRVLATTCSRTSRLRVYGFVARLQGLASGYRVENLGVSESLTIEVFDSLTIPVCLQQNPKPQTENPKNNNILRIVQSLP